MRACTVVLAGTAEVLPVEQRSLRLDESLPDAPNRLKT
jgi:hypothetical protein